MDNKFTISQEALDSISLSMVLANKKLQETPSEKFERNFQDIIQKEIEIGVNAATHFKAMIPSATNYTHTNNFPLPIYEALTEEALLMLEEYSIYLSKNEEIAKANIRIVFHF